MKYLGTRSKIEELQRENAALREASKKALDFACEHEGELHGSTYLELVRLLRAATEGHSQGGGQRTEHDLSCKAFSEPGCDCGLMEGKS